MHVNLDRGRHLDIQRDTQSPDARHLRGADTHGEGPQRAVARGMRVGAEHQGTRQHVAIFREDLVADAALVAADFVKFPDALGGDKLPDLPLIVRSLPALGRHAVIEDDGDPIRVPHFGGKVRALVDFVELVDD